MSDADQPKFIVDDDWKSQAKAEKEKLAQQDAAEKAKQAEAGEGGAQGRDPNRPVQFTDLVQILATQALSALGVFPDPQTGQAMVAPEVARIQIDLLGVVQEKTKGNLSTEEQTMIDSVVSELRFQYVETMKAVEQAIAEGKISPEAMRGQIPAGPPPSGGAPGAPGGSAPGPTGQPGGGLVQP